MALAEKKKNATVYDPFLEALIAFLQRIILRNELFGKNTAGLSTKKVFSPTSDISVEHDYISLTIYFVTIVLTTSRWNEKVINYMQSIQL